MPGVHKLPIASMQASIDPLTPCAVCLRDASDIAWVHKVNVLGPLAVTQALLPLIKKGREETGMPLTSGSLAVLIHLSCSMSTCKLAFAVKDY